MCSELEQDESSKIPDWNRRMCMIDSMFDSPQAEYHCHLQALVQRMIETSYLPYLYRLQYTCQSQSAPGLYTRMLKGLTEDSSFHLCTNPLHVGHRRSGILKLTCWRPHNLSRTTRIRAGCCLCSDPTQRAEQRCTFTRMQELC